MALISNCPACGAPVEYSGNQDEVTCGFCGNKFKISEDAGASSVTKVGMSGLESGETKSPAPDDDSIKFTFGEPVDEVSEPVSSRAQVSPAAAPPPRAQVSSPAPDNSGQWKRWAIIGVVAVVVICLMCVCAAVAVVVIANGGSGY